MPQKRWKGWGDNLVLTFSMTNVHSLSSNSSAWGSCEGNRKRYAYVNDIQDMSKNCSHNMVIWCSIKAGRLTAQNPKHRKLQWRSEWQLICSANSLSVLTLLTHWPGLSALLPFSDMWSGFGNNEVTFHHKIISYWLFAWLQQLLTVSVSSVVSPAMNPNFMKILMFCFCIIQERCWFNSKVILEAVVCGSVELYCIILTVIFAVCPFYIDEERVGNRSTSLYYATDVYNTINYHKGKSTPP